MDAVISWSGQLMHDDNAILAQRLRDRDPDVLEELIDIYQHRLFRYLLSLTGNRAAAEDLFQDTWLRVLERGQQYNPHWRIEVWLFGIARHLMVDLARRKKDRSLDTLLHPDDGPPLEPAAANPSPFEDVWAGERAEQMARMLTGIPTAYREAITLRFQEDLTLEEIAGIVKAPLSTVKSRLYRGLDMLRAASEERLQ